MYYIDVSIVVNPTISMGKENPKDATHKGADEMKSEPTPAVETASIKDFPAPTEENIIDSYKINKQEDTEEECIEAIEETTQQSINSRTNLSSSHYTTIKGHCNEVQYTIVY